MNSPDLKRTVFYISDGTGITVETLGHSLLSQFVGLEFEEIAIPYVNTETAAEQALEQINNKATSSGVRPIIFSTLVKHDLRKIIARANGLYLDLFNVLPVIAKELNMAPTEQIGRSHAIRDEQSYKIRIDAVHFALENDDGARTRHYDKADIILVGVSRCGKTPTSLYLALQFGIWVANYPITEEDIDDMRLPKVLREHKSKLFGLTINPERLSAIRNERKPNSRYSSPRQCEMEVNTVEMLFRREGVSYLDSTDLSIEEISTRILAETGIKRRLQ